MRSTNASLDEHDSMFRADGYEVLNAGTQSIHASKIGHFLYGRNSDEVARNYHNRHPRGAAIGSTDGHGMHVGLGLTGYSDIFIDAVKNGTTTVAYDRSLEDIVLNELKSMLLASPKYYWGKIKSTFAIRQK